MKTGIALTSLVLLAACAAQPRGVSLAQLESPRYLVTQRQRLPIDLAGVQQNLFRHAAVCHQTYTFEMDPHQSVEGRVVWRPRPDAGWDESVVVTTVLLQNRSINVKAYSYRPGALDRVHSMLTAMMAPDHCKADSSWENKLHD